MPTWLISGLSPGHFPVFSPDALHPAWRLSAAVPESDMRVEIFDTHLKRNSGNHVFSSHQVNSAMRVQGIIPWSGVWGLMPPA